MSKVDVFNHAWIDLVFEGRNQSYGAYQLRRQDSRTTVLALVSGIGLMLSAVAIPAAVSYFTADVPVIIPGEGKIIQVDNLYPPVIEPKKEDPKPEVIKDATPPPAAPANTTPTTELKPLAATNEPVDITTKTDDFKNTNPGQATDPGDGKNFNTGPVSPPGTPGGNGTNTTPETGTGETIETFVDVMPMFPGGMKKFYEEVGRKFRTPEMSDQTTLKVYVSFVVEKDGTMTNIKVLKDPGYSLGREAIRVLQSIKTKWTAGKKGGNAVRTAYNLPITVNIN